MSEVKYTPGPWIVDDGVVCLLGERALGVLRSDHKTGEKEEAICVVSLLSKTHDTDRANARLIAAAPELLEALKELASQNACSCDHPHCRDCHLDAIASEAIAKAEGREM